jgi:hypothetical protein
VHQKFLACRAPIQLMGGGYGNGKTAVVCIKAIQLALGYPGSNGLIGRATYAKLNDTIRKELFKWLPKHLIARMPTTNDNTLYLTNGSVINFRYISQRGKKNFDGSTTSNLLSATYDWAIVDQMEDPEIEYKDFLDLLGRMRGTTPYKGTDRTMPFLGPGWLMMTTNPTGNWVYTKLVKPIHEYMATGHVGEDLIQDPITFKPMLELFEAATDANKHLPPEFIAKLRSTYKGQMLQRYFYGKWAAFEGLVYPEFGRESHMMPHYRLMEILQHEFRTRNKYEAIEGFDHGIGVPSCYLLGFTDHLGRVIILDGFYEPGLTESQIYAHIDEIRRKYDAYLRFREPIWADPAIFKRTQVKGETITTLAQLLEDRGLYIKPGQNAIESGIMKVTSYVAIQPMNNLFDDFQPGPNLLFSDNLQFIADEFLSYFWKKNTYGDQIDQPVDRNDHAMDTIKFMLSIVPDATELSYFKPAITPEHLKWHEAR